MKLRIGTPLWRKAHEPLPVLPEASTAEHDVFVGCTLRDKEDSESEFKVASTGRFLVRVHGPVSVGDTLVQAPGQPYLVAGSGSQNGVGTAEGTAPTMDNVNDSTLIPMTRGGGGGGGGKASIPEWADTGWSKGDFVVRSTNAAIDDGRKSGTWEAQQWVPAGTDAAGPSLDNSKWRLVALHGQPRQVWRTPYTGDEEGHADRVAIMDSGRDTGFPPSLVLLDSKDDEGSNEEVFEGSAILIRVSDAAQASAYFDNNVVVVRLREFRVCDESGNPGYALFLSSPIYYK